MFDTYVPPSITGQSVKVSVNGQVLAKLSEEELAGRKVHVISLPDDLPREKVNTIDFTMGKTVKVETAGRKVHVISLPDDLPREKVNTIDFTMGKTVKVETDTRHLSVLFAYVGLEPLE